MTNLPREQDQIELFKDWIRKRLIAERDFLHLPPLEAIAWSTALPEMSQSLTHAIVPFQRQGKGKS